MGGRGSCRAESGEDRAGLFNGIAGIGLRGRANLHDCGQSVASQLGRSLALPENRASSFRRDSQSLPGRACPNARVELRNRWQTKANAVSLDGLGVLAVFRHLGSALEEECRCLVDAGEPAESHTDLSQNGAPGSRRAETAAALG